MSMTPKQRAEKNGFEYDWGFANNAYSRTVNGIKQVIVQAGYDRQVWRLYCCNSRSAAVKDTEEKLRGTFAKCMREANKYTEIGAPSRRMTMAKSPKEFKLPPSEFSNVINFIYKDFDFTGWESSREWRLFNAGREAEALRLVRFAKDAGEDYHIKVISPS